MSLPIKGDEAVDKLALEKHSDACQYIKGNLRQLSQSTLTGLLTQFDEISTQLKTVLEWRLKQSLGGTFVKRLEDRLSHLDVRLVTLERKLDIPVSSEETASVEKEGVEQEAEEGEAVQNETV